MGSGPVDGSELQLRLGWKSVADDVSFNYCPGSYTPCHFFADFLPHYVFRPGWGGPSRSNKAAE